MNKYVKIGLLITLSSIAAIVFVLETSNSAGRTNTYTVSAYLDDATGLLSDSKVRMHGVEVGSVKKITLDEGRARVDLLLDNNCILYEDAVFEKRMESLLGTASVSVLPGTREKGRLNNGAVIRSVESNTALESTLLTMKGMSNTGNKMMEEFVLLMSKDIRDLENEERSLLVETMHELKSSLQNMNLVFRDIHGITSVVHRRSEEDLERFNELMYQLSVLTANLNSLLAQNSTAVDGTVVSLEESITLLNRQLKTTGEILEDIHHMTRSVNDGEGSMGKLMKDDTLYERVVSLTKEAEEAIQSTLGVDLEVDFSGNYLLQQGGFRNQVGIILSPRGKDKHYSAGVVDRPGSGKTKTTTTVTTSGGLTTEEITSETVSGWVPFLQLAYDFGPVSLRGGLIEGEVGFGLDYLPVDMATLSLETYGFDMSAAPFLRFFGALRPFVTIDSRNPLNWLYLSGGVDDILGKDRADFFFGAGLRFQDNDLKSAVTVAPLIQ